MNFLILFSLILILVFIAVFFSPSSLKAAITGAPFLPTPKSAIRKALGLAGLKPNELLYDLGSGTGKVLIVGSKEFGAEAIGFEYSRSFAIISKINLFLHRAKNAKTLRKSFFEANLSNADVIFMFLTPKAFKKLQNKLTQELKQGSRIVTFSSPLLFWQPEKVVSLPNSKAKVYLYRKS